MKERNIKRNCKKCVICGRRRVQGSGVFLARIPLDPVRCRMWVKVIGQEDLVYLPIEKLHQLKYVCDKHFQPGDFNASRSQLLKHAVPSLNLNAKPLQDELLNDFPLHIGQHPKTNIEPNIIEDDTDNDVGPLYEHDVSSVHTKKSSMLTPSVQTEHTIITTNLKHLECPVLSLEPVPPELTEITEPAPIINPELLKAETPEWGDDINGDISQRWEQALKNGLNKEHKEDMNKKYPFSKNLPSLKAPILNSEIAAVLSESCKSCDSRIANTQDQLGRALAALGKVMTGLLTKTMDCLEAIKTLNDAGKMIADSHYAETETRRSLITPILDKSFVEPFKDRIRDDYLFGQNLGDFIKFSKGFKKTGQLITPPLNAKGPSQRQQRDSRSHTTRSFGPIRSYQQRRVARTTLRPPPLAPRPQLRAPPAYSQNRAAT